MYICVNFLFPYTFIPLFLKNLFLTIPPFLENKFTVTIGEEISTTEGAVCEGLGKGWYMIKISAVLAPHYHPAFSCCEYIASYANSPKGCYDTASRKKAKHN
jgi:hypothetical protein